MKVSQSNLNKIIEINTECFTSDDPYSDINYLKSILYDGNVDCSFVRVKNRVVGFILYKIYKTHIESLRRGVTSKYRGRGLGLRLSKALIRVANNQQKKIYTYVSRTNLPSLNSNFKVGYRVTDITDDWIYIVYKPKEEITKGK